MSEFVTIVEFGYRHEAELARGFLDDAGIPSQLLADDASGVGAGWTFSNAAALQVLADDAEKAREVLRSAGVDVD